MSLLSQKTWYIAVGLFILSFTIYVNTTAWYHPTYSYHHHLYTADAFLHGHLDLANAPDYYHDLTNINGKRYSPFGLTPALVLLPFVAVFGVHDMIPQYVGAFLGALNVVLVFLLLKKTFPKLTTSYMLLTTIFFAFGTVYFYTVSVGSTWYFAHIVGLFFLLLAGNLVLSKFSILNSTFRILVTGVSLGLAVLSRAPLILSLPFFIAVLYNKHATGVCACQTHSLGCRAPKSGAGTALSKVALYVPLLLGFILPIIIQLLYNHARFGTPFQDGHALVYHNYQHFPVPTTIFQVYWPGFPLFHFLDIRNIPLHVYTAFFLPPQLIKTFPYVQFLPYGTSILLTSPLLLLIPFGLLKRKKQINFELSTLNFELINMATAILIMLGVFLHFMQGWVQFSYRYALDFMPFLLIPLSIAITHVNKKLVYTLLVISIIMNTLGVFYGAR